MLLSQLPRARNVGASPDNIQSHCQGRHPTFRALLHVISSDWIFSTSPKRIVLCLSGVLGRLAIAQMASGKGSVVGFEKRLSRLEEHTEASSAKKGGLGTRCCNRHHKNDQWHLHHCNVRAPMDTMDVMAAMRIQIMNHRRILTTTCRVVEMDVCNMITNHALVTVGIKTLFDKLFNFFEVTQ